MPFTPDKKKSSFVPDSPAPQAEIREPNIVEQGLHLIPGMKERWEAIQKHRSTPEYKAANPNPEPVTGMEDPVVAYGLGMAGPDSIVNTVRSLGKFGAKGVDGLKNFLKRPANRANLLDMWKNHPEQVQPLVSGKIKEAEEMFNAKNVSLPYAMQKNMGNGKMTAMKLEDLIGVSPKMDAEIARIRAAQTGESAKTYASPGAPEVPPIETNLKSYATNQADNTPTLQWSGMPQGAQKFAKPAPTSEFGNPLKEKMAQAIQKPELPPPPAPKGPVRVQADPNASAADFADPNYHPRPFYGLKEGESLVPFDEAMELRKLANAESRFSKQQMFSDPTAVARNEKAMDAGNSVRRSLSDSDSAMAGLSDELEDAYALRDTTLSSAGDKPIAAITGTSADKTSRLAQFDKAAGSNLRELGQDVDTALNRSGNSRAREMFNGAQRPWSWAYRQTFDRVPRAADAAAQKIYPLLNQPYSPEKAKASQLYYFLKGITPDEKE